MSSLNSTQSNYYRNLLLEKEQEVKNTIEAMTRYDKDENIERSTELSNYDNHPADSGTQLYQTELQNALVVHEENMLKDIKEAYKRLENGKYGICEQCGESISTERLEVAPSAKFCIACENDKAIKLKDIRNGRPNEELVLDNFMGRKYLNKQEDDENEGLDIFNDLMKYGSSDTPQDLGGYKDYEEFYTNKIDKQGLVDEMDGISNEYFKKQLPD